MRNENSITIHNVMQEMRLDCNGFEDDLEIQYHDKKDNTIKKVRSNYLAVKMNRNQSRDIEIEWE